MRSILASMVAVSFGLLAIAADPPKEEKKDEKKAKSLEDQLLGKWKMVKSDGNDTEGNFHIVYKKGGVMEFHIGTGDDAVIHKGKYKAIDADKDNKLGTIDWTIDEGGSERGEVSKINELSADKLAFTDPQGVKEEFERVKEKKEEKKEDKKDK